MPRTPERRLSRGGIALVAAAAVLAVAAAVVIFTGRSGTTRSGPQGVTAPVGAAGHRGGSSPGGATQTGATQAGAIATATAIVAQEPALVGGDDASAVALVSSWAAPSAAPPLVAQVRQERASFAQAKGGPYSFEVAPLAAKVSAGSATDMTVHLWCSEVVFAQGKPSYGSYVTESVELTWQGSSWWLVTTADNPGPTVPLAPSTAPSSVEDAAAQLAGFGPVGLLEKGH